MTTDDDDNDGVDKELGVFGVERIKNKRHARRLGLEKFILEMHLHGYTYPAMEQELRDSFDVEITEHILRAIISDNKDITPQLMNIVKAKQIVDLERMAKDMIDEFVDGYKEARSLPETVTVATKKGDLVTVPNEHRLKEMDFYSKRFGEWWDRTGKLYAVGSPTLNQQNIKVEGDVKMNTVEVVMDELRRGSIDTVALERIVERLDEGG